MKATTAKDNRFSCVEVNLYADTNGHELESNTSNYPYHRALKYIKIELPGSIGKNYDAKK